MQPERWQSCTDVFNLAVERPPDERAALLEATCDGDEALRRKVELLLKYHDTSGDFMKSAAFEVAPELLAGEPEALIGQHLGCYRVDAIAGIGGMGVVYLAWDERLGRKVALKLLPQSMVADKAELARLKHEAHTASALNHPNIVTIHDIGEVNSTYYVATEFIEGTTLRERMTNGAIPPNKAMDIAAQVASALCVAHRAGIVHRDIKPENIMLRPDGYVKVLDFGIAKLTQQETSGATTGRDAQVLTRHSMVLGTTRYMSPEQTMAQQVDARSDLWSLGVVLYEMLAGGRPFEGETATDVITAILESDPPPLRHRAPGVPPALQSVVERSLRKNPAERYQTAEEMLSELRAIKQKTDAIATRKGRSMAVATIAALLVGLALFYTWRGGRTDPARAPAVTDRSIAVLPFENSSRDPENGFFADGVQDEILTRLAKVADLKVISRTSTQHYQNKPRNLREIAKQLGVANILEGSVQKAGNAVRVNVQLINAASDAHLWAETYDRKLTDIFAVESDIAKTIADTLEARLTGSERQMMAAAPTTDTTAYELYHKGRSLWEKRSGDNIPKSIAFYEQAIARDPNYALAYAGLAKSYMLLPVFTGAEPRNVYPKAKEAALKALRLDSKLADAHLALGQIRVFAEIDLAGAMREYKRAIELQPNDAEAHHWFGMDTLATIGRFEEAIAEGKRAVELDPLSPIINADLGAVFCYARRYDESAAQLRKTLDIDPTFFYARYNLGIVLQVTGDLSGAIAEYEKAKQLNDDPYMSTLYAAAKGHAGDKDAALRMLTELDKMSEHREVLSYWRALLYLSLNNKDETLRCLEQSFEERDGTNISWIKVDPMLDSLHGDPRFEALVQKVVAPKTQQ